MRTMIETSATREECTDADPAVDCPGCGSVVSLEAARVRQTFLFVGGVDDIPSNLEVGSSPCSCGATLELRLNADGFGEQVPTWFLSLRRPPAADSENGLAPAALEPPLP